MPTLVLLRHGGSEWDAEGRFAGWSDVPLSAAGVSVARPVAELVLVALSAAKMAAGTRIVRAMLDSTGSPLTAAQLGCYERLCAMPTHVHATLAMMARWDLPTLMRDLATLETPLDIIAGRRDRWVPEAPLRRAVARVRGATYRVEDGGHLLMEERAEEVAGWIRGTA